MKELLRAVYRLVIRLTIILCLVKSSLAASCPAAASNGNIVCDQVVLLGGGLCSATLNNFISVTAGRRSLLWTDTGNVSIMTAIHDQVGNIWVKMTPSVGFNTAASPQAIDQWWTTVATTTASLNLTATCTGGNSFEIAGFEFHSTVGTVGIDCFSVWTPFDNPPGAMNSSCSYTGTNDVGLSFIDWGSVNPTPGTGWSKGSNDTEDVSAMKSLGAPGVVTSIWNGSPGDFYITSVIALNDGGTIATFPVMLSMQPESQASGCDVFRSSTSGGPYTKVNSTLVPVSSGLCTYTDLVVPHATYYYVLSQVENSVDSGFSNQVTEVVP